MYSGYVCNLQKRCDFRELCLLTFQLRERQNRRELKVKDRFKPCSFFSQQLFQLILQGFQRAKLSEEMMTVKVKIRTEDSC